MAERGDATGKTQALRAAYGTEEAARRWASAPGELSLAEAEALSVIPAGARVLDLGGGAGRVAAALAARGCRVTVADLSLSMAVMARAGGFPAVATPADILPFRDQSFDAVAMIRLLPNLPGPERRKTLVEALRVLKPGGFLAATAICPSALPPFAGCYAPVSIRRGLKAVSYAAAIAANILTDAVRGFGIGLSPRDMVNPAGEHAFFHHLRPDELTGELLMGGWGALRVMITPPLPGGWQGRLPFPGLETRTLAVVARRA
jgi:SAM-dependent methyltransferase